ncbi:hypothetical protein B0J15DRAFT_503680, partial [Fusarium solani]
MKMELSALTLFPLYLQLLPISITGMGEVAYDKIRLLGGTDKFFHKGPFCFVWWWSRRWPFFFPSILSVFFSLKIFNGPFSFRRVKRVLFIFGAKCCFFGGEMD